MKTVPGKGYLVSGQLDYKSVPILNWLCLVSGAGNIIWQKKEVNEYWQPVSGISSDDMDTIMEEFEISFSDSPVPVSDGYDDWGI